MCKRNIISIIPVLEVGCLRFCILIFHGANIKVVVIDAKYFFESRQLHDSFDHIIWIQIEKIIGKYILRDWNFVVVGQDWEEPSDVRFKMLLTLLRLHIVDFFAAVEHFLMEFVQLWELDPELQDIVEKRQSFKLRKRLFLYCLSNLRLPLPDLYTSCSSILYVPLCSHYLKLSPICSMLNDQILLEVWANVLDKLSLDWTVVNHPIHDVDEMISYTLVVEVCYEGWVLEICANVHRCMI